MPKKKLDVVTLPLKTQKATVAVEAKVPAVLLDNQSAPATTTAQQDLVTLRQSRINFIWEGTQGVIAIILVLTVCIALMLEREIGSEFWILVSIVVQSYFQRTNHTRIGGIGYKPVGESR